MEPDYFVTIQKNVTKFHGFYSRLQTKEGENIDEDQAVPAFNGPRQMAGEFSENEEDFVQLEKVAIRLQAAGGWQNGPGKMRGQIDERLV